MKIAVYPGSFDPLTNGHLDIIKRASKLFDKIIILVAVNSEKKTTFTCDERVDMIKKATEHMDNIEVDYTEGLTIEYARRVNATSLVRGLRAVSDFEYEFQIASTNEFLDSDIEMVFLMTRMENTFISSSIIKELHAQKIDISKLVPKVVIEYLDKIDKR